MLPLAAFAALLLLWGRDEALAPFPLPEAAPAVDDPLVPAPTGVQTAGQVSAGP